MNEPEVSLKEKIDFIIGDFDKRLEIIINIYERLNLTIEHIKKIDEAFEKYENNDGIKK